MNQYLRKLSIVVSTILMLAAIAIAQAPQPAQTPAAGGRGGGGGRGGNGGGAAGGARGGGAAAAAPGLFFKEDFKAPGAVEAPVTAAHLVNANLEVKVYGPGKADVDIVHHDTPADDPYYIWSGTTTGSWALTLRDKENFMDLSGRAKIKWRIKEQGFALLRPVVKLADGTLLVGDYTEKATLDWHESEFGLTDVRWLKLDPTTAVEASPSNWVVNPDLSKVDEIGFTDLRAGTGHGTGAFTRFDWIEVYANKVPR